MSNFKGREVSFVVCLFTIHTSCRVRALGVMRICVYYDTIYHSQHAYANIRPYINFIGLIVKYMYMYIYI